MKNCEYCNGTGSIYVDFEHPQWITCEACKPGPLWHGGESKVPREVAVCPECQGTLAARSMQWDADTGQPEAWAIELDCETDCRGGPAHRHFQSDWQPVRDAVAKWSRASC